MEEGKEEEKEEEKERREALSHCIASFRNAREKHIYT